MVSDFTYHKKLLLKERMRSLLGQILFFMRSSNLKGDIIVENQCLKQYPPFDVRNFFSVRATPLPNVFIWSFLTIYIKRNSIDNT